MDICPTQHFIKERHKSKMVSFSNDRHMGGIASKKKERINFIDILTDCNNGQTPKMMCNMRTSMITHFC